MRAVLVNSLSLLVYFAVASNAFGVARDKLTEADEPGYIPVCTFAQLLDASSYVESPAGFNWGEVRRVLQLCAYEEYRSLSRVEEIGSVVASGADGQKYLIRFFQVVRGDGSQGHSVSVTTLGP
jgi:hypothetical protein